MKKAEVTYSNKRRRRPQALPKFAEKRSKVVLPRWVSYGATVIFTLALCLTINFRAITELNREVEQNNGLSAEIEKVTTENLGLQEEIYYLQNDSKTIEREARKFGYKRQQEKKVSVPVDK